MRKTMLDLKRDLDEAREVLGLLVLRHDAHCQYVLAGGFALCDCSAVTVSERRAKALGGGT